MRIPLILTVAGLWLLLPSPAYAWGPMAHVDFGLSILRDLSLLAPPMAALLKAFADDFLYGTIAADITIGKDLSPYRLHCHNWRVGFSVLDQAKDDDTRAFAWGYLAHLAADTVAHNFFVPGKLVENFNKRTSAHAYWELRYDTRVSREAYLVVRRLGKRSHRRHDRHLKQILSGPLFSFPINRQLFRKWMVLSRVLSWQRLVQAHAKRSSRVLTQAEVDQSRRLSIEHILDLLRNGRKAHCLHSDPTGHRNLLIARDLRLRLRRLHQQGRLKNMEALAPSLRPLFLASLQDKLELPSLDEFAEPEGGEDTALEKPRGLLSGKNRAELQAKKNAQRVARVQRKAGRKERRAQKRARRKTRKAARSKQGE